MPKKNTEADFWNRVDKTSNPNGCWEFTGGKDRDGYGFFRFKGYGYRAHRFASLISGKDPTGLCVLHSCDNPSCVNPAHLSLGTHQDNMDDKKERGRVWRGGSKKLIKEENYA